MKKAVFLIAACAAVLAASAGAQAATTYHGFLSGLNETTPNASPGTGYGTVVLNDAQDQITVNMSWADLTAAATAAHIHGPAALGTNAGVLFGFTGVAAATSGAISEHVFSITPTQVGYLNDGLLYFNIHTGSFPGGEIRGQIQIVPEPSSLLALASGLPALALALRRRKAAQSLDT